jgi:hypothetical protein
MLQIPNDFAQTLCGLEIQTPERRTKIDGNASTQRGLYKQGTFYTQVVLHGNALNKGTFLHRRVNTQILLHRGAFTHRRTGASTHWCLYTAMRLHTCAFAQGCFLHRGASTHRGLYGQILSHKDIFTTIYLHRRFFAQIILQRGAFTRKYFYRISQREREKYTQLLSQRDACTHNACPQAGALTLGWF